MRNMVRRLAASLLLLVAALAASPAEAGLFFGDIANSTDATGSNYEGEFIYAFTSSTDATLTINLTNLTPAGVGGFMTAFVFNVPDAVTGVTLTSANPATMDTFFSAPTTSMPSRSARIMMSVSGSEATSTASLRAVVTQVTASRLAAAARSFST